MKDKTLNKINLVVMVLNLAVSTVFLRIDLMCAWLIALIWFNISMKLEREARYVKGYNCRQDNKETEKGC